MKYTVMECHEGYAVLTGEDSRFVRAANLHYSVGQTVTSPVILAEDTIQPAIRHSVFIKIVASAACLALISAAGFSYYRRNLETHSVLTIGSEFNIQIELNSKGQVIRMDSRSTNGKNVLEHYNKKNRNMVGTVNDIIDVMKTEGYITTEDTVEVYISADSKKTSDSYKNEIEHKLSVTDVNVSVIDENNKKQPVPPVPAEPIKDNTNNEIKDNNQISDAPSSQENAGIPENTPSMPEMPDYMPPKSEYEPFKPILPDYEIINPEKDTNNNETLPTVPPDNEDTTEYIPDSKHDYPYKEPQPSFSQPSDNPPYNQNPNSKDPFDRNNFVNNDSPQSPDNSNDSEKFPHRQK